MTSVLPDLERSLIAAATCSKKDAPEGPRRRRPDRQTTPPRLVWRLVPALAAVVGVAVVVVVVLSVGSSPSIIAHAYAATNSAGRVLYYKTTTYSPGTNRLNDYEIRARSDYTVWTSGNQTRLSGTEVLGGGPDPHRSVLSLEVLIDGANLTSWEATLRDHQGVITKTLVALPRGGCSLSEVSSPACGDPLNVVRNLYRSGALHMTGQTTLAGHKVDVLAGTSAIPVPPGGKPQHAHTRVLVDARSFTPLEVELSSANSSTTTTTFSDFTRLPLNATNRKLLQMSPHPGAPITHTLPNGSIVKSRVKPDNP